MITALLIGGISICQGIDFYFTNRRISLFGLKAERNELLKKAILRFGRTRGIALAMLPLAAASTAVCALLGTIPLALLAGAKLKLVAIQVDSLSLEKELRGLREASLS